MDQATLAKLWTVIGAVLFYFSVNVWSITQGGNLALPVSLLKEDKVTRYGASIYGLVVAGLLLVAEMLLTRLYAVRSGKIDWTERLPIAGALPLEMNRPEARWYQRILLTGFLLVPLCAQVVFATKFFSGTAYKGTERWASGLEHLWRRCPVQLLVHPTAFIYDPQKDKALAYFPLVEPWAFLIFSVFNLLLSAFCLSSAFLWPIDQLVARLLPSPLLRRPINAIRRLPCIGRAVLLAVGASGIFAVWLSWSSARK
jgi:hypothetical protein